MLKLRTNWLLIVLGLLALKALQVPTELTLREIATPEKASSLYGWDTSFYYFWLRSAALDFDVDFENDIELSNTLPEAEKRFALETLPRTEKGLVPNKYPIGWSAFHLPWFALGHASSLALRELGIDVRTDGYGKVYEAFLYLGSLLYAALALWLTFLLLRRFFERRIALASLALVWVSSFLIFYQARQYAMAHSLTYLCVVSAFFWAFAIRDHPGLRRNWLMLGLSVGLLLVTRYQAALYLLFPFVVAVTELWRRRAGVGVAIFCVAAICVPVGLQLLSWKALYGSWLLYTYQGEGFLWTDPQFLRSLFDANHGLFHWHPMFLVGLVGFGIFMVKGQEALSWLWLLSIVAVTYINAAWHSWWFGASFGNRAYEGVTLFVFFGVAQLLKCIQERSPVLQAAVILPLLLLALWNIAVLEVTMYSWHTGVGLEGAETYRDLWNAAWRRFFE